MSFPFLRKRIPSQPVITADLSAAHGTTGVLPPPAPTTPVNRAGALSRILAGAFGTAEPASSSSSFQVRTPGKEALYHYHEGDIFTPGTGNYVFEYPFEFPLQTIWGIGFLRQPNTFPPVQPPQVIANPNVFTNGIGGLIAGQYALQPLESDGQ